MHFIIYLLAASLHLFSPDHEFVELYYTVTHYPFGTEAEESRAKEIQSQGVLICNEKQSLYYERNDYLNNFPGGKIVVLKQNGVYASTQLSPDSVSNYYYVDMDSALVRSSLFESAFERTRFAQTKINSLTTGQRWKPMNQIETINGMQCEKFGYYLGEKLITEIWVNPEIAVSFGPYLVFDTPGLVVKAISHIYKKEYLLNTFEQKKQANPVNFWPDIFNRAKF